MYFSGYLIPLMLCILPQNNQFQTNAYTGVPMQYTDQTNRPFAFNFNDKGTINSSRFGQMAMQNTPLPNVGNQVIISRPGDAPMRRELNTQTRLPTSAVQTEKLFE